MAMQKFGLTRTGVIYHLRQLKAEGLIRQEGNRNKTSYYLVQNIPKLEEGSEKQFWVEVDKTSEEELWNNFVRPLIPKRTAQNVVDICHFGVTEIFNNVIDHSQSQKASVRVQISPDKIVITICDFGIGIFKKVAVSCGFTDYRESILKLTQGKFTTAPSRHSGEGIFFTSRAFDHFAILANGLFYSKDNGKEDDWYFETRDEKEEQSTLVKLEIFFDSKSDLKEIFQKYTNPESFQFNRTHIRIELSKFEEDQLVSRSQAKRLLHGLKDFKEIILDFKNIRTVGQAFVDEVFFVFGNERPQVHFLIDHAVPDVIFMIKRGISTRNINLDRIQFRTEDTAAKT